MSFWWFSGKAAAAAIVVVALTINASSSPCFEYFALDLFPNSSYNANADESLKGFGPCPWSHFMQKGIFSMPLALAFAI